MVRRWVGAALAIGVVMLAYVAWRGSHGPGQPMPEASSGEAGADPSAGAGEVAPAPAADPGIEWRVPRGWSERPATSMRLATYEIPGSAGAAGAQCAVFYFGPGQGGSIEANIERWAGEFDNAPKPERSSRTVGGIKVEGVRVRGDYASHGGTAMGGATGGPNYELLGAIVEGPAGSVFFKLTGPAATVGAARKDFDGMIGSLRKK